MTDQKRFNTKQLCIEAYEDILLEKRQEEMRILNAKRKQEIEKNRPPEKGWYMGHGQEFAKELYRNRVDLRPRNKNKDYLNTLRDSKIY